MQLSGNIDEFETNGSEAAQEVAFQGTGPFARSESDLLAGANTAEALAGLRRVVEPARAISSSCCTHHGASQDSGRSLPDHSPNTRAKASGLNPPRRALMRRYCPNCRPNQQNNPETVAVERMQAAPVPQHTCMALRRPPTYRPGAMSPLFELAAQRGGQADTETVTAERNSQDLIAST